MAVVELPDIVVKALGVKPRELSRHVRELLAVELYREGVVSIGKTAEIAGVSRWEILELLHRKKIPIKYTKEDIEEDLETLEKVMGRA